MALNSSQLLSLFSQIDAEDDDDDVDADDDDDGDYHPAYQNLLGRQRSSVPPESVNWRPAVTEPQEPGAGLLFSGEYGRIGPKARERAVNPSNNIAQTIARRSEGRGRRSLVSREDLASVSTEEIRHMSILITLVSRSKYRRDCSGILWVQHLHRPIL